MAKVLTCAVVGLDGALVEVEVDIGSGLPAVTVVGLPDAAVQESKERVRAAIKNSGCTFPIRYTDGILPMVSLARDKGITTVYVPAADALEASLLEGVTVIPVEKFAALVDHLRGERLIQPYVPDFSILGAEPQFSSDFSHVKGQRYT